MVRRVAITTTHDRAAGLAEMLTAHQLTPVVLPCVEVTPAPDDVLERARSASADANWIVATSPRTISSTWPQGAMPNVPVAVVGPSTAVAVEEAGGRVEIVSEGGAADLIAKLVSTVAGKSVTFPHAAGADPYTVESLEKGGAHVMAIPVYETHPIAPGPDQVDAAIFGSPSAIAGWCRSRSLDGLVLAVIGETTGQALEEHGYEPDVIPDHPDFGALVAALDGYLRERSPA